MTGPNDIDEATWERALALVDDLDPALLDQPSAVRSAARAPIAAKAEGMREAAGIASRNHGDGVFNAYENGRRDASQAILSAIPKEPT